MTDLEIRETADEKRKELFWNGERFAELYFGSGLIVNKSVPQAIFAQVVKYMARLEKEEKPVKINLRMSDDSYTEDARDIASLVLDYLTIENNSVKTLELGNVGVQAIVDLADKFAKSLNNSLCSLKVLDLHPGLKWANGDKADTDMIGIALAKAISLGNCRLEGVHTKCTALTEESAQQLLTAIKKANALLRKKLKEETNATLEPNVPSIRLSESSKAEENTHSAIEMECRRNWSMVEKQQKTRQR